MSIHYKNNATFIKLSKISISFWGKTMQLCFLFLTLHVDNSTIMTEIVSRYFPEFTARQHEQIDMMMQLYREWNAKINVISRRDIDNLYEHHVLHSLAIARFISFRPGTRLLDFGTGGGFPGIPLAVAFPECHFRLIDGTGKKILVANEVAKALGLTNVEAVKMRGEDEKGKYHFVVSRAVMPLPDLHKIVKKNISAEQNNTIANGIICLKGGNIDEETRPFGQKVKKQDISLIYDEEWYKEKYVIYMPI